MPLPVAISTHDVADTAALDIVDRGIGDHNDSAAPLDEVRHLSCIAHSEDGTVIGGAVGRTWGACAELQQLWVAPSARRQSLGRRLMAAFEAAAAGRGVSLVYLDTFSFQALDFYRKCGYEVKQEIAGYGHGIVRYSMLRHLDGG